MIYEIIGLVTKMSVTLWTLLMQGHQIIIENLLFVKRVIILMQGLRELQKLLTFVFAKLMIQCSVLIELLCINFMIQ